MPKKYNYYESELNSLNVESEQEYKPIIKIHSGMGKSTKYMTITFKQYELIKNILIGETQKENEIKELINLLAKNMNYLSCKPEEIGKIIAKSINAQHRTIQQQIITALISALIEYSLIEYCDQRNQSSKELTTRITEFLENDICFFNGKISQPFI